MRKILHVMALCVLISALPGLAQYTPISASHLNVGGQPIAAGKVLFTPVDSNGQPIAFVQGGGGLNSPTAFSCNIVAGALSGCQIPDACLTTPANILYNIDVNATANLLAYRLPKVVGICGASPWALDAYAPTAPTTNVQPIQMSYGTAAAPDPCVPPSEYIQNSGGGKLYICVGGHPVLVSTTGGGATIGHTPLVLKGDSAGNGVAATPGTDYVIPSGNAATATQAANSSAIEGVALSGLCQTDGTNCPPVPTVAQTTNLLSGDGSGNAADSGVATTPCSGCHGMSFPEGTALTGASGVDKFWGDSTSHRPKFNPNNAGALHFVGITSAGTDGHLAVFAPNGLDILDGGAVPSGGVPTGTLGQQLYYGADGSTVSAISEGLLVPPSADATGATDGVNIGNACTSVGSVRLAAGAYHVGASNAAINLTAPCKIQGQGPATIITNHGTTNDIFRISYFTLWNESPWSYPTSTNQTEISHMQFAQSGTPTAGYVFDIGSGITQALGTFSYTMNVHIHDVTMNGMWGGVKVQSDELYITADSGNMWRNFVGGGCINYNAEVGSGDNHWGPGLECSGLANSGIIIGASDVQHFLGVKLNGSGIKFTGVGPTKSVIFDDVSVETGISQPCMIDFGTGTAPVNIQFNNSEQYGFAQAFCNPTNVTGFAFAFNNSLVTSDYPAGLIRNSGYTTVTFPPAAPANQDSATFAGTVNTLLSAYTTTASKTFVQYTADGVTPQVMPVLSGSTSEVLPSGSSGKFGDVLDTLTPSSANYSVGETFTIANTSDQLAVFGRASNSANTNYVCLYTGSGHINLYSQVAGSATLLLSVSFTWSAAATHIVTLSMTGTSIGCAIDGVAISGSPVTNSAVTGVGQAGSRINGGATGTNFFVQ